MSTKVTNSSGRAAKVDSARRYFSLSEITKGFKLANAELEVEVIANDDFGANLAEKIVRDAFDSFARKIAKNKAKPKAKGRKAEG